MLIPQKIVGVFLLFMTSLLSLKAQDAPNVVWQSKATNNYTLNPIAVSPDRKVVATMGMNNSVQLWHASNGVPMQALAGHTAAIWDLTFSANGMFLASSGGDSKVRVWRTTDWTLAYFLPTSSQGAPIAFSPDSTTLAVGSGTNIELRHATNGMLLHNWTGTSGFGMAALAFSPDGTKLASGAGVRGMDTALKIWSVPTGNLLRTIPTSQSYSVGRIVFSPDGNQVLTGSEYLTSGPVESWRVSDGELMRTFPASAFAMAFNGDGTTLCTAGQNIVFYRFADGSIIQEYLDGFASFTPGKKGIALSGGLFFRSRGTGEVLAGQIPIRISTPSREGGQLVLRWFGGTGPYRLQRSFPLGSNWENEGGVLTTNFTVLTGTSNSFYRVIDLLE